MAFAQHSTKFFFYSDLSDKTFSYESHEISIEYTLFRKISQRYPIFFLRKLKQYLDESRWKFKITFPFIKIIFNLKTYKNIFSWSIHCCFIIIQYRSMVFQEWNTMWIWFSVRILRFFNYQTFFSVSICSKTWIFTFLCQMQGDAETSVEYIIVIKHRVYIWK